ncbi:MAG: hypothetical protein ACM3UP_02080 [Methanocella sp.]
MSVRVFLGGTELVGLRDPSYADPLIAVCQAAGLDFTYCSDLECLFIASPLTGALVALRIEEPDGDLQSRLTRLLRGAGAQVVSEVGAIGRRYGDVALRVLVTTGGKTAAVTYPAGSAPSRVLACNLSRALDHVGLGVLAPRPGLTGFGSRVPLARVEIGGDTLQGVSESCALGLFLGVTRFLWWRVLAQCHLKPTNPVIRT